MKRNDSTRRVALLSGVLLGVIGGCGQRADAREAQPSVLGRSLPNLNRDETRSWNGVSRTVQAPDRRESLLLAAAALAEHSASPQRGLIGKVGPSTKDLTDAEDHLDRVRAELRGAEQLLFSLLKESASRPDVMTQPSIDKLAVQFVRASVSARSDAPCVQFVSDDEACERWMVRS